MCLEGTTGHERLQTGASTEASVDGSFRGIAPTMRTTIDKAGRIVVPKALRRGSGSRQAPHSMRACARACWSSNPFLRRCRLVRRDGGLVATTDEALPPIDADDVRAVTESVRR